MQKYIIVDSDNVTTDVFTELDAKTVLHEVEAHLGWDSASAAQRLKEGDMKLYEITEIEVILPEIPEMKFKAKSNV